MSAYADSFYELAGYICDATNDQLLLTYDGAYNEYGEAMVAGKRDTQWDPWSLVARDDDGNVVSLETVHGSCRLSDGVYEVAITPSPGNLNIQGRCGAWMTARATIAKEGKTIFEVPRFENDCHDTETPIITRVILRAKEPIPEVETVQWQEFYQ